ncbi:MAG: DUF2917 domain-containing protein [Pseudomonadota bacterium]
MHNSQPSQNFQLDTPQQTLALRLAAGAMVQVSRGRIWLTLEGHSRDVWLKAQDRWTVPLDAKVWISAEAGVAAFAVRQPTALPPKVTRRVRAGRPPVAVAA